MSTLQVPPDDAWLKSFGVAPEAEGGGAEFVHGVQIPVSDDEDVCVSWDPVGDWAGRALVRVLPAVTIVDDLLRR